MDGKKEDPNDAPTRREAGDATRRDEAEPRPDTQEAPKASPRYRDWASI